MVLICSGLLLVKTKQCCAPFPLTAIKLEVNIIYALVFQQCSAGREATLGQALFTHTHTEVGFFIPQKLNLKWKPQMQSALTSGYYQILLATISKPISQQCDFFFFPPQLEETTCHITGTADWTGWDSPSRHCWSCCSSTAGVARRGCFSFLHQNTLCHVIIQSRPPAPIWELFGLGKHRLNCLWTLSWRCGPWAAFFYLLRESEIAWGSAGDRIISLKWFLTNPLSFLKSVLKLLFLNTVV